MSLSPLIVFGSNPSGNVEVPFASLSDEVLVTLASTTGMTEFAWTLVGAPSGSSVVAPSGSVSSFSFTPDYPGTYLFRVVVNDGDGVGEAFYAVLTEGVGIRIPAPKETTQAGASGWSDSVNSAIAVLSRLSGRGASVVCKNASGASMAKGVAVVLAESDDGEGRPSVILADASALESAPAGAAVFGISNGDPETGGSVADDGFVSVTFGPGFFFGVTVEGSTPASFPSPVTWGSAPGLLAYGDDPVIGSALADGFVAIAPSGSDGDLRDLFAVDHDLDGETGYHKTVNQQGARADAEDPVAYELLREIKGPAGGVMREYSYTAFGTEELTFVFTTHNARLDLVSGEPYFYRDNDSESSLLVMFGTTGFEVKQFVDFDDTPVSPESASPVVFGYGRWKSLINTNDTSDEALKLCGGIGIKTATFSGDVSESTRVTVTGDVDLGHEDAGFFRQVRAQRHVVAPTDMQIVGGESDPSDELEAGSIYLKNDGSAYIRGSFGWNRVGLQDYVAQEVSSVSEPMIRVHPDFPGVLEAYLPATVKDRGGNTVYIKRPDGTSDLRPVKLVFKPGDGMVGTSVDGDGDLVDGVAWETAYPLTTAQAAVCTQAALGAGASACYSLQVNRKTGTIHLVRPLDTPVETPVTATAISGAGLVIDHTAAIEMGATISHLSLWGVKNIGGAALPLGTVERLRYAINNTDITVRLEVYEVNQADTCKPGALLAYSADYALPTTGSSSVYAYAADMEIDYDVAPGQQVWVMLAIRARSSSTLYVSRGQHKCSNVEFSPYIRPFNEYVYYNTSSSAWTIYAGSPVNSTKTLTHGRLVCGHKNHPRVVAVDASNDCANIAYIGQAGLLVDGSDVFEVVPFRSLWRGSATTTDSAIPVAIAPTGTVEVNVGDLAADSVYNSSTAFLETYGHGDKIILFANNTSSTSTYVVGIEQPATNRQEIEIVHEIVGTTARSFRLSSQTGNLRWLADALTSTLIIDNANESARLVNYGQTRFVPLIPAT